MSLNIFLERVSVIYANDDFFNMNTMLSETDIVKKILVDIDGASYYSSTVVSSRFNTVGNIYKEFLSTGCKTLLNVVQNRNKCFSIQECGVNVLNELSYIEYGNILYDNVEIPDRIDCNCDIMFNNRHFTNFIDFVNHLSEVKSYEN